jgi:hypothetical protein
MLKTLAKATVCSFGVHDWNENNQCTRCGRMGCLDGRHEWHETNRQVIVRPKGYSSNGLSDDWTFGLAVTTTTKLFYECTICGATTQASRVEEGYAGRA